MDEYSVTVSNGEITIVEKGGCPKTITIVNQKEEGKIQIGDELAINTEHFYVVSSDENETIMLSKHNLLVGYTVSFGPSGPSRNNYTEEDDGYGLQTEMNCVSPFGLYWETKVGEELIYSGSYSHPNYPYVYDNNSVLYKFVELYKTKIEKLGVNVQTARLLTYQEAINLGCEMDSKTCPTGIEENSFISETSFWTGSAYNDHKIWYVSNGGSFSNGDYPVDPNFAKGVRPVIVIKTSDI